MLLFAACKQNVANPCGLTAEFLLPGCVHTVFEDKPAALTSGFHQNKTSLVAALSSDWLDDGKTSHGSLSEEMRECPGRNQSRARVCSRRWVSSVLLRKGKERKAANRSVMQGECADSGRASATRPATLTLHWMYVLLLHLKCCLCGALVSGGCAVNRARCAARLYSASIQTIQSDSGKPLTHIVILQPRR